MKLAGSYCFLLLLSVFLAVELAFAQPTGGSVPSASRHGLARFAEEDVTDTGVGDVHPIPEDEHQVQEDLVEVLETDELTTVVGDIELGELLCESLEDAAGSSLLRFTISSTETVIAERTSYSSIDGSILPDGNTRKTWLGEVVDPELAANSIPRTVSMTWTDPCDTETFLLKLVSRNSDGSTSIVTSVPCSAGSDDEMCMVELEVFFYDESEAVDPTESSSSSAGSNVQGSRMLKERRVSTTHTEEGPLRSQGMPSGRSLQGTTVIDVLIFYSPEAASERGITDAQLVTKIVEGMVTLNQAITNSAIAGLEYRLVQVALLPYSQGSYDPNASSIDLSPELIALAADSDVASLRNQYQGDLVQLVGYFPGACGIGFVFDDNDGLGFSLVDSNCFDNFSHTHEIAHNMGCYHDRANSVTQHAYSHGYRYCDGTDPYRTIMSYYQNGCDDPIVPRVNYFSNPDVTYLNKPTGTNDEDNARCIEDSMVAVSEFRMDGVICTDDVDACTLDSDCCVGFCGSVGTCATEECGSAGGDTTTVEDSVCDADNNIEECQYDGGDCCECDCSNQECNGDNTCVAPAWDCVVDETLPSIAYYYTTGADAYCPGFSSVNPNVCDPGSGQSCFCTCRESDPDTAVCGSGSGFNCIDPAPACDECGVAGGDTNTMGDSVCDPANNVEVCGYDDGDCCECECTNQVCDGDNTCDTPTWDCVADEGLPGTGVYIAAGSGDYCSDLTIDDLGDCDYTSQGCLCTCRESDPANALCGSGTGFDCIDPASDCACEDDGDCTLPEECCLVKKVCEVPDLTDPTACGDPHMTGFHGQKFDFTGNDGQWYCLISDLPSMHLNMRVTAPVSSRPDITYITGLSLITTDGEGHDHSVVISVKDPHSLDSDCPAGVSPCLSDGSLSVVLDGSETLTAPGAVELAPDVQVIAVNLPGACRSFGFEKYWERKKLEYAQAGRRLLSEQSMGEWILGDLTATNMAECTEYVTRHVAGGGDLFAHQSEHASFQIVTPTAVVRLSHGRLHQIAELGLPDHLTWQMNLAVDHNDVSLSAKGVLGETLVPTRDASGKYIMHGMGAIRGSQEDYRVDGPLGLGFNLS